MSGALEIAAKVQALIPKGVAGTFRFWGVWFGRPYDNWHRAATTQADGNCLILTFEGKETLRVWDPERCAIHSSGFIIAAASRVLWQWHSYGRPETPENLMQYDFVRMGEVIRFDKTDPLPMTQVPNVNEPAVELHSIANFPASNS